MFTTLLANSARKSSHPRQFRPQVLPQKPVTNITAVTVTLGGTTLTDISSDVPHDLSPAAAEFFRRAMKRERRTSKVEFSCIKIRPVTRLQLDAAPGNRPGLRAFLIVDAGRGLLCATALAAPAQGEQAASAPGALAAPSDFVGSETCATCHDEIGKEFANNPAHQDGADARQRHGITCENCHGAGKAHVEGGGDMTKIFNPAKASPKEVDAKCLSLPRGHAPELRPLAACQGEPELHQLPQRSRQQDEESLLKAPQPTLCLPVPRRPEGAVRACRSTTR